MLYFTLIYHIYVTSAYMSCLSDLYFYFFKWLTLLLNQLKHKISTGITCIAVVINKYMKSNIISLLINIRMIMGNYFLIILDSKWSVLSFHVSLTDIGSWKFRETCLSICFQASFRCFPIMGFQFFWYHICSVSTFAPALTTPPFSFFLFQIPSLAIGSKRISSSSSSSAIFFSLLL